MVTPKGDFVLHFSDVSHIPRIRAFSRCDRVVERAAQVVWTHRVQDPTPSHNHRERVRLNRPGRTALPPC